MEAHWKQTEGVVSIAAVHRAQNELQYRRFHQATEAMSAASSTAKLNVLVYHGTRANPPWLICESDGGLDPAKANSAPGSVCSAAVKCRSH